MMRAKFRQRSLFTLVLLLLARLLALACRLAGLLAFLRGCLRRASVCRSVPVSFGVYAWVRGGMGVWVGGWVCELLSFMR